MVAGSIETIFVLPAERQRRARALPRWRLSAARTRVNVRLSGSCQLSDGSSPINRRLDTRAHFRHKRRRRGAPIPLDFPLSLAAEAPLQHPGPLLHSRGWHRPVRRKPLHTNSASCYQLREAPEQHLHRGDEASVSPFLTSCFNCCSPSYHRSTHGGAGICWTPKQWKRQQLVCALSRLRRHGRCSLSLSASRLCSSSASARHWREESSLKELARSGRVRVSSRQASLWPLLRGERR